MVRFALSPSRSCAVVVASVALLMACGSHGDPAAVVGATTVGSGGGGPGGGGVGGTSTGGGGEGATMARDCWGSDVSTWTSVESFDLTALGTAARDPAMTDNGLALLYTARASPTSPYRIYRAARPDREAAFGPGELLADWAGYAPVSHAWRVGSQLLLTADLGTGAFRLDVAIFDGTVWSFPTPFGPLVNDTNGINGNSNGSMTADGRRMFFVRGYAGFDLKLFEASRPSGTPLEPFGSLAPVALPGFDQGDATVCPAISPDGLHLFFSSTYPNDLSGGLPDGALTVWYTERTSVGAPWAIPTHVGVFDDPILQTCIHAVSDDGCEAMVEHFTLGEPEPANFKVGRR